MRKTDIRNMRAQKAAPLLLASVASLLFTAASALGAWDAPHIVNGLDTQARPTVGALLGFDGEEYWQSCSGTLVGCRTFLTAAHCVCPGDTAAGCTPDLGEHVVYLQHGGIRTVEAIAVPSNYSFAVRNDVAVVTLATPPGGIPPTRINTHRNPPLGSAGIIAGYGTILGGSRGASLLREGRVVTAACFDVPEPAHVCWEYDRPVGAPGTDSNTCYGDSGGPLFADLGSGEVVIGVTSGGETNSCGPDDNPFDANVYRARSFIRSVGGSDLDQARCGPLSQVGEPGTVVLTPRVGPVGKPELNCRREVRRKYERYVSRALRAWRGCLDGVGSGASAGPCPDAALQTKLARAAEDLAAARFAKRCSADLLRRIELGGACTSVADLDGLSSCLQVAGDEAVGGMLAASYADEAPTGPIAAPKCQSALALAMEKYEKTALTLRDRCQLLADKGRVAMCPDDKTQTKLGRATARVARAFGAACTAADLAALRTAGDFGASCSAATTPQSLATCQTAEYDGLLDTLQGVLTSRAGPDRGRFDVPPGAALLRVTLNGMEGGRSDVDLYLRRGTPPTRSEYDFASTNRGLFEAIDVSDPTAGTWYALVDEIAGRNIPVQLTISIFSP